MFDISLGEMALVMVVAVLAIGPKELPTVVRKITNWIRQMKAMVRQITDQFTDAEGMEELHALRAELREKATYIRNTEGEVFRTYDISDILEPKAVIPESGFLSEHSERKENRDIRSRSAAETAEGNPEPHTGSQIAPLVDRSKAADLRASGITTNGGDAA